MQSSNLYDIYLMLYVQSSTPVGGRKNRPKHIELYSINLKIVHLVGFTTEIYRDARSHERKKGLLYLYLYATVHGTIPIMYLPWIYSVENIPELKWLPIQVSE